MLTRVIRSTHNPGEGTDVGARRKGTLGESRPDGSAIGV